MGRKDAQYRLINLLKSLILRTLRTLWRIWSRSLLVETCRDPAFKSAHDWKRVYFPPWLKDLKEGNHSLLISSQLPGFPWLFKNFYVFLFIRNQSVVMWLSSSSPSVSGYNWARRTQRCLLGLLQCPDLPFPYPFTHPLFPPQKPYILSLS